MKSHKHKRINVYAALQHTLTKKQLRAWNRHTHLHTDSLYSLPLLFECSLLLISLCSSRASSCYTTSPIFFLRQNWRCSTWDYTNQGFYLFLKYLSEYYQDTNIDLKQRIFLQITVSPPPPPALWLFLCCIIFGLTSVLWVNPVKLWWTGQNAGCVLYFMVTNGEQICTRIRAVFATNVGVKSTRATTISCTRKMLTPTEQW